MADPTHDSNDEPTLAEQEAKGGLAGALGVLGCLGFVSLPLTICILVVLFLLLLALGQTYIWG